VPISVEGRLWGVMIAGSREESLPADTEARLAGFTEMVATAVADAQARVSRLGRCDPWRLGAPGAGGPVSTDAAGATHATGRSD